LFDEGLVIAEIRADMPGWARLLGIFGPALLAWLWGVVATSLLVFLVSRRFVVLDLETHWTERARHWAPVQSTSKGMYAFASLVGACLGLHTSGPFSLFPVGVAILVGAVGGYAGVLTAELLCLPWFGATTRRALFRRYLISRLCFGMGTPFGFAALACVDMSMSMWRWGLMSVFVSLYVVASLWVPVGPALRFGAMRLASAPHQEILHSVSRRLGHEPRPLLICDLGIANAFALYLVGRIVISDQLVEVLEEEELELLLAHEVAHLEDSVVSRFGAALRLTPRALFPFILASAFESHWVAIGLTALAALLWWIGIRNERNMEDHADEVGATQQFDEGSYARILEKIYAYNLDPAVTRYRETHAHLYDRMLAAGVTPDYPRPEPPPEYRISIGLVAWTPAWLAVFSLFFMYEHQQRWLPEDQARAVTSIFGGAPVLAERLSYHHASLGEYDASVRYAKGMVIADEGSLISTLHLAFRQCEAGLAEDARATHARALELARQTEREAVLKDPEHRESMHHDALMSRFPDCKVQ